MKTLDTLIIESQSKPSHSVTFADMQPVYFYAQAALTQQPSATQETAGVPLVNQGTLTVADGNSYVVANIYFNYGVLSVGNNAIFAVL